MDMKEQSTEKIDPVDAVIDAWKLAMALDSSVNYDASQDTDEWLEIMKGGG